MGKLRNESEEHYRLRKKFYTMRNRCYRANASDYKYYGGKGIKICDEWLNDINVFIRWGEENGFQLGLTIDRIDTSKDYCPSNCQLITHKENVSRNNRVRGVSKVTKSRIGQANRKIKEEALLAIIHEIGSTSDSYTTIGLRHGVNPTTVANVNAGKYDYCKGLATFPIRPIVKKV